jgi:membrane fusion protein, multidrug efflux system
MQKDDPQTPGHRPGSGWLEFIWHNKWLRLVAAVAVLAAAVAPFAIEWTVHRWTHSITDDAFVETHIVNIGPEQVSGHLVRFLVQEHDVVAAGQLLVEIDPVPYREQVALLQAKLDVAKAQLAAEESALEVLRAQVPREIEVAVKSLAAARAEEARDDETLKFTTDDVAKAIQQARSAVDAAQAHFVLADEDFKRFTTLYKQEAATQRQSQEATKTYTASQAEVKVAEAKLDRALAGEKQVAAARKTVEAATQQSQKAEQTLALTQTKTLQITEAERRVEVKKQQVEETRRALQVAQTDLRYTRIVAPFPSVIVKLYRHLGDYVPVGTPILSIYNPELTYVTANLEETKLEGVAPGNAVQIDVDAFSEPFRGRVVWINKATGANFALVPRNISSGEFTKVVQRVPVRILIEKDDRWAQLRAGLSVTVSIAHGPGDPEWARRAADAMRALEANVQPAGD